MTTARQAHLEEFYGFLHELAVREGGPRRLAACTGRDGWPASGVYFFFEDGETRADGTNRIVRVGTHGLRPTSNTTLWQRLRQHRGQAHGRKPGGGNHRGSIFRQHVGTALIQRDGLPDGLLRSWTSNTSDPEWAQEEDQLERAVSRHIGEMPFLWLAVPTRPDGTSERSYIERNSIALLSRLVGGLDQPSTAWLGHHATSGKVRHSGLWNSNHVNEAYDPAFLRLLATLTE